MQDCFSYKTNADRTTIVLNNFHIINVSTAILLGRFESETIRIIS